MGEKIPAMIALCEADLRRRAEVEFTKKDTLTISASPTNLPSDFREFADGGLWFDTDAVKGQITLVSPGHLSDIRGRLGLNSTGIPKYAAVAVNGTKLYTAPPPDQARVADVIYETKLTPLSDTATTNWVLTDHPDVYLYGTLKHSAPFLKNDPRLALWSQLYEGSLVSLDTFIERRKYKGGKLIARPRRALGE
jgi:hypothetical protein